MLSAGAGCRMKAAIYECSHRTVQSSTVVLKGGRAMWRWSRGGSPDMLHTLYTAAEHVEAAEAAMATGGLECPSASQ